MGEFSKSPQIPVTIQREIELERYLKISLVFFRTPQIWIDYSEVTLPQTTAN